MSSTPRVGSDIVRKSKAHPDWPILLDSRKPCVAVRLLREELQLLQEPGSYVGEVVKIMGKNKVLVKVNPEGKYVVDLDKSIDMAQVTPGSRVALKNDSYTLHYLLPTKVKTSAECGLHTSQFASWQNFFLFDITAEVALVQPKN